MLPTLSVTTTVVLQCIDPSTRGGTKVMPPILFSETVIATTKSGWKHD
jgi:hypothetical protein